MQFKSAIICAAISATSIEAFAPSMDHSRVGTPTNLFSSLAISAEDINAKLAIQMEKLKKKDSTSKSLTKDVRKKIPFFSIIRFGKIKLLLTLIRGIFVTGFENCSRGRAHRCCRQTCWSSLCTQQRQQPFSLTSCLRQIRIRVWTC